METAPYDVYSSFINKLRIAFSHTSHYFQGVIHDVSFHTTIPDYYQFSFIANCSLPLFVTIDCPHENTSMSVEQIIDLINEIVYTIEVYGFFGDDTDEM